MRNKIIFLAFGSFVFGSEVFTISSETKTISKAIIDVIKKSFLEDVTILNIITFADKDVKINVLMSEIVNEVSLNVSSDAVNLRISDINNLFIVKEKRFYNIFLIANYETYEEFKRVHELFDFQGFFLVVIVDKYRNQYRDMKKIFQTMWESSIINVNALVVGGASDSSLEMFTFYPFTAENCGDVFPVLTNKFINSSFLMSQKHYEDKLTNLFGCPLKVVTFNIAPLMFIKLDKDKNNHYLTSGIEGELLIGKKKQQIICANNILWQI